MDVAWVFDGYWQVLDVHWIDLGWVSNVEWILDTCWGMSDEVWMEGKTIRWA